MTVALVRSNSLIWGSTLAEVVTSSSGASAPSSRAASASLSGLMYE